MVAFNKLLSLAAVVVGALASDVVQLTEKDFNSFINSHDVVIAEFFAPWCGHCQALAPEYENAATILKERNVPVVKIDCTEEETLCASQAVQGYPTLKVFKGTENVSPYKGARTSNSIVSYMTRQALPAVSKLTSDNAEEFFNIGSYVVLGFFGDEEHEDEEKTFTEVAENLKERFLFASTNDAELIKEYGVEKFPSIIAIKNFELDKGVAVYKDEPVDADKLSTFVTAESVPLIGEIGPATFNDYMNNGLPLFYIFADNEEDKEKLSDLARPWAEKLKGKLAFGTLNAQLYGKHAVNLNLREEFPALAIEDFKKSVKYLHSQEDPITEASIKEFLDGFVDGTLEPSIKSEPVPTTQEGPVYTVVAKNWEEVVMDDDKDVLIEFYATWCGHCKNLAPTYEELGSLYFDHPEYKDKVVVAKINHPDNECPVKVRGYPTIKLYPAGKKDEPVSFEQGRTLENFVNFIKEKGTHGVDGLAEQKKAAAEAAASGSDSDAEPATKKPVEKVKVQHDDL